MSVKFGGGESVLLSSDIFCEEEVVQLNNSEEVPRPPPSVISFRSSEERERSAEELPLHPLSFSSLPYRTTLEAKQTNR